MEHLDQSHQQRKHRKSIRNALPKTLAKHLVPGQAVVGEGAPLDQGHDPDRKHQAEYGRAFGEED